MIQYILKIEKWYKKELKELYNNTVEKNSDILLKLIEDHINANCEEEKILIATCFYNELSSICIKANETIVEEHQNKHKSRPKKKKDINYDEETSIKLKNLHEKKCLAYINYRDSKPAWNDKLGIIYNSIKKEYRQYQRYVEKNKANLKFKELNDLFKSDRNGFWRDIKKMNHVKQVINVPIEQIKSIYKELFNKSNIEDEVRDSADENELKQKIDEFLKNKSNNDKIEVVPGTIKNIVQNMKTGKAVGFSNVSNEMLKYGMCDNISKSLAYFMEWSINSGSMPKLFNISLLKPLVKDTNKSSEDSNNLRPLSISDVYPSIFEQIIATEVRKDHTDHCKQFGFKPKASCAHATFVLNECIKICKETKRDLIVISIDASKAFDKVNRTKLWLEMFKLKIRPTLIIALMNYYKDFYFIVNNENDYSSLVRTTFGVKQGGNISPDLYKIYTEPIATRIETAKLGLKIGNMLINVLMYADDVILLAGSIEQAQKMLDIVTDFGYEYQIKYNPTKTNVMIESTNKTTKDAQLLLCNKEIVKSNEIKYLGSEIKSNGKARLHIETRKTKSIKAMNGLRTAGILNNYLDIKNKILLYNIYIKPLLYYGLESILLNKGDIDLLEKTEGNNIKQVIGIPNQCRSTAIYGALKMMKPIEHYKFNQFKFLLRALENEYVKNFMLECIKITTKTNVMANLRINLHIKPVDTLDVIIHKINDEIKDIKIRVQDRYIYNEESQIVAKIFNTNSYELRKLRLMKQLYYKK